MKNIASLAPAVEDDRPTPPPVLPPPTVVVEAVRRPSGVDWLPERLPVNADAFDLYVPCPAALEHTAGIAVPSAQLYLLGRLQPVEPGRAGDYLLRVRVEPGGAVDLSCMDGRVPPHLQHLRGLTGVHLLPAGWLDRVSLCGRRVVGDDGSLTAEEPAPAAPVLLRCEGARHGVPGLPNEVRRWPRRTSVRAYALIPDAAASPPYGYLPLHRRRPRVRPGHRLLQLRVPRREAIDIAGTAERLAGLGSVRSQLAQLHVAAAALILPRRGYDRATVVRVQEPGRLRWRGRRLVPPVPLSALVAPLAQR
jgi:hypothetical protein